jgi:hypothetical protein
VYIRPYIIFIVLFLFLIFPYIYYTDVCLCDSLTLNELKIELTSYTNKYNDAKLNFQFYKDLFLESLNRPEPNNDIQNYICIYRKNKYREAMYYLNMIRRTEASIKDLDPNFVSSI